MTPWVNEGFFARVIVLVEGEDDCAAIHGIARSLSLDFDGCGISVIPVQGKRSLDRPAIIFQEFGIPVFVVWDSDEGKGATSGTCSLCQRQLDGKADPADNRRLLRITGGPESDWPSGVGANYCCFKNDLEHVLKEEIGDSLFEDSLATCQSEFGIKTRKHALKNPSIVRAIIENAKKAGKTPTTLNSLVEKIGALGKSSGMG
jgi:predicted ATP-dependent endonuclease of OLD family